MNGPMEELLIMAVSRVDKPQAHPPVNSEFRIENNEMAARPFLLLLIRYSQFIWSQFIWWMRFAYPPYGVERF